jgi:hypothetical protein
MANIRKQKYARKQNYWHIFEMENFINHQRSAIIHGYISYRNELSAGPVRFKSKNKPKL